MTSALRDISDTALLTADMRATESTRRHPLFVDPYAERLAGERAKRIAPIRRRLASDGGVIARTAVLDEMIVGTIDAVPITTVLNLGAGLDARPYRLALASTLRWIEVDLPEILAYKTARLAAATPRCSLERHAVDLADPGALSALLGGLGDGPTVVLSEGLVPYLEPDAVAGLARALAGCPAVAVWCLDLISAPLLPWANRFGGRSAARAGALARFAPEAGPVYFDAFGWRAAEVRSTWLEQRRVGREAALMRVAWTIGPARARAFYRDMGTIVRLERDTTTTNESGPLAV